MSQQLVSVMVPVYNKEDYIEDCLNSILNQTYPEIELFIADDCSTDHTLEIIKRWADRHRDSFVRCEIYEHETNYGITKNFNFLLTEAKGEYLKWLSGDDMLLPDAIEKEVEYLWMNPDADIVYANAYYIGPEDKYPLENMRGYKLYYECVPQYEDGIAEALFKQDVIAAPTVMFRKTTIEKFGVYCEDYIFEDWEYWLRIATGGGRIGYLNCPVVGYRVLEISGCHYGKGEEEEKRYNRVVDSEERILLKYRPQMKDGSMDHYWNGVLQLCMERDYTKTIKNILRTKEFKLESATSLKLLFYRIHIYRLVFRIWRCIKQGIHRNR